MNDTIDDTMDWRGLELRASEQVKAARDALEQRCELQLETIRGLRAKLESTTAELVARNRMDRETIERLKQVTSEHALEVNRLTVDNDALRRDLYSVINERDQAWDKIVELRAELDDFKALCGKLNDTGNAVSDELDELSAELQETKRILSHVHEANKKLADELDRAIEVKNRCVASVNRLCSQVVELQAQLKGKE